MAVRTSSVKCLSVRTARYLFLTNLSVEYNDSQEYEVPNIDISLIAQSLVLGYFCSGTCFQKSIVEQLFCFICFNPSSYWSSSSSNSIAAISSATGGNTGQPFFKMSTRKGFSKNKNDGLSAVKSRNLSVKPSSSM